MSPRGLCQVACDVDNFIFLDSGLKSVKYFIALMYLVELSIKLNWN